ncbi:MAG: hypothetical protein B7Z15_07615 [Rhizobiales bacterium 32-66-8]|jgi:hypothetical protein|nr:MAG: hypothetical protein B7Z15_07615 [Rhizobiales bacterium 32-66-8]
MEATQETTSLISTSKVKGTDVYNTEGDHIGLIEDVMLDKRTGKIAYAVLAIGSIFGLGGVPHPLPWQTLKYDTRQGGYVTGATIDQMRDAPAWSDAPGEDRVAMEDRLHRHFGVPGYWAAA